MGSPVLAGLVGIASHLALDAIPHGDDRLSESMRSRGWSTAKFVAVFSLADSLGVLALLAWLFLNGSIGSPTVALAATAGAILPDFLWGLAALYPNAKLLRWPELVHLEIHRLLGRDLVRPWIGYGVQLATLAAALVLLQR